jgi:hypothetical protein
LARDYEPSQSNIHGLLVRASPSSFPLAEQPGKDGIVSVGLSPAVMTRVRILRVTWLAADFLEGRDQLARTFGPDDRVFATMKNPER